MVFDIYQLDEIEAYSTEAEKALNKYEDTLIELFFESPEGQEHRNTYPGIGFWAGQLIYYGYSNVGVTIPQMKVKDIDEITSEIFPRKISLSSPDDAKKTIPELVAFWKYLKREYKLSNADVILKHLQNLKEEDFVKAMNNPSKFGMAKSFFMAGQAAGYDMSNEEERNTFMLLYNAAKIGERIQPLKQSSINTQNIHRVKPDTAKEKRKRKAAKAARKRNRR